MSAVEAGTQTGRYVDANGLDIYYEEYGSGEPLLLLHAGMCNLSTWDQTPLLSEHFRVISFDRRGHGRTRNPDGRLDYGVMADDAAAFIEALGMDRPLVCGYSDGGIIALTLAIRHPNLARAYVSGAAQYEYAPSYLEECRETFGVDSPGEIDFERLEHTQPELAQEFRALHDPFQGEGYWQTLMAATSKMWLDPLPYTFDDLKRIQEPTLILAGDRDDGIFPVEQAVEMYRAIPRAELAVVPGGDHFVAWSKAELVGRLMLDFLQRHATAG